LVAATIFVIGIVAVLSFFPTALKQLQVANQRTISAELAESNMAEVRVATAEALFNQQFLTSGLTAISHIYQGYELYSGYFTAVSPMRGGDSTFLQRVTLTVQMPDGREETYVTYVAKQ
jgi:Tfp pilus assembly protein PilV